VGLNPPSRCVQNIGFEDGQIEDRGMRRDPIYVARARELRANETAAEARLWSVLRAKRLGGFKFRRQHPMGKYIADFVCLPARLIIEVDGATHGDDQEEQDAERTAYLEKHGFRVMRVGNTEIYENLDGVAESIGSELGLYVESPAPLPDPLP
jgi:very-short-patch-repair endonuclease